MASNGSSRSTLPLDCLEEMALLHRRPISKSNFLSLVPSADRKRGFRDGHKTKCAMLADGGKPRLPCAWCGPPPCPRRYQRLGTKCPRQGRCDLDVRRLQQNPCVQGRWHLRQGWHVTKIAKVWRSWLNWVSLTTGACGRWTGHDGMPAGVWRSGVALGLAWIRKGGGTRKGMWACVWCVLI